MIFDSLRKNISVCVGVKVWRRQEECLREAAIFFLYIPGEAEQTDTGEKRNETTVDFHFDLCTKECYDYSFFFLTLLTCNMKMTQKHYFFIFRG